MPIALTLYAIQLPKLRGIGFLQNARELLFFALADRAAATEIRRIVDGYSIFRNIRSLTPLRRNNIIASVEAALSSAVGFVELQEAKQTD
jgi:hypothetical protein